MYQTSKFMTAKTTNMYKPTLDEYTLADKFESKKAIDLVRTEFWISDKQGHVLDIAGSVTDLIYYPRHGGNNQAFNPIPINFNGVFQLYNFDLCLEYIENSKFFMLVDCNSSNNNQLFEFLDAEKFDKYMLNGGDPAGYPRFTHDVKLPDIDGSKIRNILGLTKDTISMIKDLHGALVGGSNLMGYPQGICGNMGGFGYGYPSLIFNMDKNKMLHRELANICSII